jgi:hypothetical protein
MTPRSMTPRSEINDPEINDLARLLVALNVIALD